MRRVFGIAVVTLLAAAGAARADDASSARKIIEQAVKAAGGEAKLAQFQAFTIAEKGTYFGMGDGVPFTATVSANLPKNQYRLDVTGFLVMVMDGDKGWVSMNGNTQEMSKEQLEETREGLYSDHVVRLVPLLRHAKDFTLTPLDEIKVNGQPAVGVKVSHKGHRDIKLYFDKETHLVLRMDQTVKDAQQGGGEIKQETVYSDVKTIGGAKFPMKETVTRDGNKYIEGEFTEVKPVKSFKRDTFAKPE
jgi:hypothetical protein